MFRTIKFITTVIGVSSLTNHQHHHHYRHGRVVAFKLPSQQPYSPPSSIVFSIGNRVRLLHSQRREDKYDDESGSGLWKQSHLLSGSRAAVSRLSFLMLSASSVLVAMTGDNLPSCAATPPVDNTFGTVEEASSSPDSHLSSFEEKTSRRNIQSETLVESVSGFVSGGALSATKTLIKYPLDTATVRLQMPNTSYSLSDLNFLFRGSFRGISAPLITNIPAGAVFFAVKDAIKSLLSSPSMHFIPKWATTSLSVAVAQIPYWALRNPSEVIKTRQQAGVEGYEEGVSVVNAFRLAMLGNATTDDGSDDTNGGGIMRLYTGYWENIFYAFPADVLKFICYEGLTGGRNEVPPFMGAVYGAASTAVAQFVSTPLDVVRNRVMMVGSSSNSNEQNNERSSYVNSLIKLARDEGLSGFFAGASPRVGKAILSGAIQFATYEETKQSVSKLLTKRQTNKK